METKIIYPDDLSDEEWDLIKHLVPKGKSVGRLPTDRRQVLNAIFYILRSGCNWRMLLKAYLRPGYHVDALLDTSDGDNCEDILKKLEEVNIPANSISLEGRTHLVIRDVNTREVADNIRRLN